MATSDDDEELRRRRLCRDRDETNTTSIDDDYAKGKCDKELNGADRYQRNRGSFANS